MREAIAIAIALAVLAAIVAVQGGYICTAAGAGQDSECVWRFGE